MKSTLFQSRQIYLIEVIFSARCLC